MIWFKVDALTHVMTECAERKTDDIGGNAVEDVIQRMIAKQAVTDKEITDLQARIQRINEKQFAQQRLVYILCSTF